MVKKSGLIFSTAWKHLTSLDWTLKELVGDSKTRIVRCRIVYQYRIICNNTQKYVWHSSSTKNIRNSAIHWFLCNCEIIKILYKGVYVTNGNPAFYLSLYLTGVHFRGELQHVGDVSEKSRERIKWKIKRRPIKTRESDTRYQIARRTICYGLCQTREYQTRNAGLIEKQE